MMLIVIVMMTISDLLFEIIDIHVWLYGFTPQDCGMVSLGLGVQFCVSFSSFLTHKIIFIIIKDIQLIAIIQL